MLMRPHVSSGTRVDVTQVAIKSVLKVFFAYALVATWAVVRGFRISFGETGVVVALCGSVLFFVACAAHAYNVTLFQRRTTGKMVKMSALGLLVTLAFLFNMYLVFYRGLWSMHTIFSAFEISTIFVSVLFVFAGGLATIAVGDLMQIERYSEHLVEAEEQEPNKTVEDNSVDAPRNPRGPL